MNKVVDIVKEAFLECNECSMTKAEEHCGGSALEIPRCNVVNCRKMNGLIPQLSRHYYDLAVGCLGYDRCEGDEAIGSLDNAIYLRLKTTKQKLAQAFSIKDK